MAKKRTNTQWHKKHVPTGWGLAILSFLLVVTAILIPVLGQEQLSFIDAAGLSKADQAIVKKHLSCSVPYKGGIVKGVCKQVTGGSGFYVTGHCPGSNAVQCYISSTVKCSTPVGSGTCHKTSTSGSGVYIPGYCPGPNNIQCLVSNATIQAHTSASCKAQKISGHATPTCEKVGTHATGGKYYTGFCSGPSDIKCWVPGATSAKTAGGGGNTSGGGGNTNSGGTVVSCGINAHRTSSNTCVCNTGDVGNPQSGCAPFVGPIACGVNAHRTSSNTCVCNTGDVGNPQSGCYPFVGPIACGVNAHRTSSNTCVCNTGDVGNPQSGCYPFLGPKTN